MSFYWGFIMRDSFAPRDSQHKLRSPAHVFSRSKDPDVRQRARNLSEKGAGDKGGYLSSLRIRKWVGVWVGAEAEPSDRRASYLIGRTYLSRIGQADAKIS